MRYKKYPVQVQLKSSIECYFSLESDDSLKISVESPPNALEAIVINYRSPYRISNQKYDYFEVPKFFINGQSIQNYTLHFNGSIGIIGVALRPGTLYNLIGLPMFGLTDERLDLSKVKPNLCKRYFEPILKAPTLDLKLKLIKEIMSSLFIRRNKANEYIRNAARKIFETKGQLNITKLIETIPMSRRNFERQFLKEIGVSPKMYAKIRRFGYSCSLMAGDREADLMDVLYRGGYYDQSHFIKDFKYFSGRTPRKYAKTNIELANLIDKMSIVEHRISVNS